MTSRQGADRVRAGGRRVLWLACAAILLTAADTYVVVLALPDIMTGVGLTTAELPRAAPIVSLFLLGYIAVLPLLGRVSDTWGRAPVLVGCLVVFAAGSALTAVSDGLGGVVAGRFLQGLGGGGLVPVTLALVADAWPADRRGVPLGAVGAVQELGSVLGPLYGAALIAASGWRLIFWVNLAVATVLAVALRLSGLPGGGRADGAVAARPGSSPPGATGPPSPRRRDQRRAPSVGVLLLGLSVALGVIAAFPPAPLARSVALGGLVQPLATGAPLAGLSSPAWLAAVAATAALLVQQRRTARPLVDGAELRRLAVRLDALGAALLAGALGSVVLALASPDPERQTLNDGGGPLLVLSLVLAVAFVRRERRAPEPLVPLEAMTPRAAWGSLLVSGLVGAALIAALVDVPLFARATAHPDSQLGAALVLLRFLVGLPVGALLGGALLRRVGPHLPAAAGCAMAAVGLAAISRWDGEALIGTALPAAGAAGAATGGVALGGLAGWPDVHLLAAGFGVGLAVAPVNDVALRAVRDDLHGLVSALVVVARNAGMLLGLSALTAVGLARFREATAVLPPPSTLCPGSPLDCPAHAEGLQAALLAQLSVIFAGAAACAALAAVAAAVLLRMPSGTATAREGAAGARPSA